MNNEFVVWRVKFPPYLESWKSREPSRAPISMQEFAAHLGMAFNAIDESVRPDVVEIESGGLGSALADMMAGNYPRIPIRIIDK